MKQARKKYLLGVFPDVPYEFMEKMKGKNAANFCIFLTRGKELFVRCFHRYSKDGRLVERQRYVFAKDGAVRYGYDERSGWSILTRFREPVFCMKSYGYSFDNSYSILNFEAVAKSDMKYCQLHLGNKLPISYLHLYCRHPNLEYLVKSGYDHLIEEVVQGYWGGLLSLTVSEDIDWKSNILQKMLRLNRTEFKQLWGKERHYSAYIACRKKFPKYKPEELLTIAEVYGCAFGTMEHDSSLTGLSVKRLARYLKDNKIDHHDYNDYLNQCQKLEYDLHDTAISMPHDFYAIHERLSGILKAEADSRTEEALRQHIPERFKFEFEYGNLTLRQPESIKEIIDEGKALKHCVGGYVQRHADGQTNIFFIRKKTSRTSLITQSRSAITIT